MSDLTITGSNDGFIRLWAANVAKKSLVLANSFKIDGFVNCLSATPNLIAAGVGTEHRLGRWWKIKGNRHNKIVIMRFKKPLGDISNAEALSASSTENNHDSDIGDNPSRSEEDSDDD